MEKFGGFTVELLQIIIMDNIYYHAGLVLIDLSTVLSKIILIIG